MKIDSILSATYPEDVLKVISWLESQPKDEVFSVEEIMKATVVPFWFIEQSAYLTGYCVEFPLGVEYYGNKAAIKLFRKKHKQKFGGTVLGKD